MTKICENIKCGKSFTGKIDGRNINIQRRRFCFECSGFGERNTKNFNYIKKEPLRGSTYFYVKRNRKSKKQKCVDYKGGKCQKCGYNKCIEALEFHHLDPSQKDFSIAKAHSWKMEKLLPELDKCMLLCANCHRELHQELSNTNFN